MICFTEQQKQEILHTGMFVVEFKRLIMRVADSITKLLEGVKNFWIKIADPSMTAKERYQQIRKLNKCGFTEKEINLMVGGSYHCRNNC